VRPMNAEIKARWLALLRATADRRSHRGVMRCEHGTDCLGLLCDAVGTGAWEAGLNGWRLYRADGVPGLSAPPQPVLEAAGVTMFAVVRLMEFTDDGGWPLGGIADWIEANL
jgi:hypothetical protein